MRRVFYTVTNARYFAGTVATLSSIRMIYPTDPIWVIEESRQPLTPSQHGHLQAMPDVHCIQASSMGHGEVHEAWQSKAHGGAFLVRKYADVADVLIHLDSDLILADRVDELASQVVEADRPAGGKDGSGARYDPAEYGVYCSLCAFQRRLDITVTNLSYMSTSIFLMPINPRYREICDRWSHAVDRAVFGPPGRSERIYAGHGDQGVLNAILFFCGIEPLLQDNETTSEHWVHGAVPVAYRQGSFWKDQKRQISFHSVGRVPKFWDRGYAELAKQNNNLTLVYLYWLFLLYDGPCGILTLQPANALRARWEEVFPTGFDHLAEYGRRATPRARWVHGELARRQNAGATIAQLVVHGLGQPLACGDSDNLLCSCAMEGYAEYRQDTSYLYAAVQRFQCYRSLGGGADLVLFVNPATISGYLTETLARQIHRMNVHLVSVTEADIRAVFAAEDIDIDALCRSWPALISEGQQRGLFTPQASPRQHALMMARVALGRWLVLRRFLRRNGYRRAAMVDADGGNYTFAQNDVSPGSHIDDIWRFDAFTDLVYKQYLSGSHEAHQFTRRALALAFELREEQLCLPMFQVQGHWLQGTAEALNHYVDQFVLALKRFASLGLYPIDELLGTYIILKGLHQPFAVMPGVDLPRQLQVIAGTAEAFYPPMYFGRSEDQYQIEFLAPPLSTSRFGICICGFDGNLETGTHKYSSAAFRRAAEYRDVLKGTMPVHLFTDNPGLAGTRPDVRVHLMPLDELLGRWDDRLKHDALMQHLQTARLNPETFAGEGFIKRPEYAGGMVSKLIAVDLLLQEHDYAGILSADADGDQFSKEAIGRLGHCHIDAIWRGLELHPFLAYIVGTATDNSFGTRLSCLKRLCGLEPDDRGPLDWIWGPCWMVQAAWGRALLADAREMTRRLLDCGLVFHDEHILNCTYNLPKYDANPMRGMRDLGEIALIGYRAINPEQLVHYRRWREGKVHAGRAFRNRENFSRFPVAYRE